MQLVRRHSFALKISCSIVIRNYSWEVNQKAGVRTPYVKYFIHLLKKLTSSRQELFHLAALIVPASLSKALEVELFPKGIPAQNKPQGDFCLERNLMGQTAGPLPLQRKHVGLGVREMGSAV